MSKTRSARAVGLAPGHVGGRVRRRLSRAGGAFPPTMQQTKRSLGGPSGASPRFLCCPRCRGLEAAAVWSRVFAGDGGSMQALCGPDARDGCPYGKRMSGRRHTRGDDREDPGEGGFCEKPSSHRLSHRVGGVFPVTSGRCSLPGPEPSLPRGEAGGRVVVTGDSGLRLGTGTLGCVSGDSWSGLWPAGSVKASGCVPDATSCRLRFRNRMSFPGFSLPLEAPGGPGWPCPMTTMPGMRRLTRGRPVSGPGPHARGADRERARRVLGTAFPALCSDRPAAPWSSGFICPLPSPPRSFSPSFSKH